VFCQTKAFYLDLFRLKLGDFIYVDLYSAFWTYVPAEDTPVSRTVVVHASFEDGTLVLLELINDAARARDMANYIARIVNTAHSENNASVGGETTRCVQRPLF
jgi:hypothetical protein